MKTIHRTKINIQRRPRRRRRPLQHHQRQPYNPQHKRHPFRCFRNVSKRFVPTDGVSRDGKNALHFSYLFILFFFNFFLFYICLCRRLLLLLYGFLILHLGLFMGDIFNHFTTDATRAKSCIRMSTASRIVLLEYWQF